MSILGNRIKKERENLSLTREELGSKIGVSYSAIAMYERGEREPNNALTTKMCEVFNCSMDYLTGISDYKNEDDFFDKNIFDIAKTLDEIQDLDLTLLEEGLEILDYEDIVNKLMSLNIDSKNIILKVMEYIPDNYPASYRERAINIIYDLYRYRKLEDRKYNSPLIKQYYMCPVYGQISAGQPNWAEENIEGRLPIDTELMGIINPEEHFFLRVNGESMNKIVKNGAFALIHKQDIVDDGDIAVVLVNGYDATLKKFTRQGNMVILEPQSSDKSFKTQVYDNKTNIKILGKYVGKMEFNK